MSWPAVRLRQAVVVTSDLAGASSTLAAALALPAPFVDPGVGDFGLENRVFAAGSDFLEVLTPVREGTAGGRYLERRGGDAGYMAIFQLTDLDAARRRAADAGMRIVWQADLDDIAGTHLHPADIGGAIVSLDRATPPESWHWAGPRWRGSAPADRAEGGLTSLRVQVADPSGVAARWADVLGVEVDGAALRLDDAGQIVEFVPLPPGATARDEGIVEVGLALPAPASSVDVAGVRFAVRPVHAQA